MNTRPTAGAARHEDPAMRRINASINRSAGQHKRAISEGTRSARAILGEQRQSLTGDPLLLHRVHHIDTERDLPADATGVAIGHAALTDLPITYAGDEPYVEADNELRRTVWRGIVAWCVLCAVAFGAALYVAASR